MDAKTQSLLIWGGIFFTVLLVTPVLFRWLKTRLVDDETPATPEEQLEEFRAARDAGEIDDEEYERLRRLIQQGQPAVLKPPRRF